MVKPGGALGERGGSIQTINGLETKVNIDSSAKRLANKRPTDGRSKSSN
jgi:hypothetical protein